MVRCNKCNWVGRESQLVAFAEDGKFGDGWGGYGCPVCRTDEKLEDLDVKSERLGKSVWREHPADCLYCGGASQIFTDENLPDGWGCDGDAMRCVECGCPGQWRVGEEEDDCYADWHDEMDCECDWCMRNYNEGDE